LRLGPEAWDAAAALSDEVDEASLPDLVTNKALVLLPTACPHLTSFSLTGLPAPGRFSFTGQVGAVGTTAQLTEQLAPLWVC
jgi:hypothetical protein